MADTERTVVGDTGTVVAAVAGTPVLRHPASGIAFVQELLKKSGDRTSFIKLQNSYQNDETPDE